jgi:hypothetical protein
MFISIHGQSWESQIGDRKFSCLQRFHEDVRESLERRKADVVQIRVPMTPYMKEIHGAVIQCIEGTLSELKRSNTEVHNAYPRKDRPDDP